VGWKRVELPPDKEMAEFVRDQRGKARFLVDESLGPAVAGVLRGAGWNAKFVAEVKLAGHSDEDVLAFAHRDDRILLTPDADFLETHSVVMKRTEASTLSETSSTVAPVGISLFTSVLIGSSVSVGGTTGPLPQGRCGLIATGPDSSVLS
jgi:uncharacterized protein DUF5615